MSIQPVCTCSLFTIWQPDIYLDRSVRTQCSGITRELRVCLLAVFTLCYKRLTILYMTSLVTCVELPPLPLLPPPLVRVPLPWLVLVQPSLGHYICSCFWLYVVAYFLSSISFGGFETRF